MNIGEYCKHSVVTITSNSDIAEAARVMRQHHVGFLVVLHDDEHRKPVGVLTDRDIVVQVTARDVASRSLTVEDLMTRQPLVANDTDDLGEVVQAMRLAGIRRVPVVDARGSVTGVFAVDDAIDVITGMLCDLSGAIKSEQRQERRARPV